jgi:hypothetical protein
VFVPDDSLGVRLRPGSTTRLRSPNGRITDVAINSAGFRGSDWDTAAPRRILLLGDSQVFGFHSQFEDTFAGRLAAPETAVFDAGVPTWGPIEYVKVLEELGPRFRPTHVVFVANVANDWLETHVPNSRRTTARDGWAASFDGNTPPSATFPGRELLFERSHLVLAARELWSHTQRPMQQRAEMARVLKTRLPELLAPAGPHRSRLTAHALAAHDLCRRIDAKLIVATLPLDVQVHEGEWEKYRTWPRDLRDTEQLATDLIADLAEAGIPAIDLLPGLRAASPGAFLDDDYHLSPRGHQVVAGLLSEVLE